MESGSIAVRRKFPDWQPPPPPLREPATKEKAREGTKERAVRDNAKEKSPGKAKGKQREEPVAPPKTRARAINPVGKK